MRKGGLGGGDVRVVICPKCSNRLAEPTHVPLYICGGCETLLQAKYYNNEAGKQISDKDSSPQSIFCSADPSPAPAAVTAEMNSLNLRQEEEDTVSYSRECEIQPVEGREEVNRVLATTSGEQQHSHNNALLVSPPDEQGTEATQLQTLQPAAPDARVIIANDGTSNVPQPPVQHFLLEFSTTSVQLPVNLPQSSSATNSSPEANLLSGGGHEHDDACNTNINIQAKRFDSSTAAVPEEETLSSSGHSFNFNLKSSSEIHCKPSTSSSNLMMRNKEYNHLQNPNHYHHCPTHYMETMDCCNPVVPLRRRGGRNVHRYNSSSSSHIYRNPMHQTKQAQYTWGRSPSHQFHDSRSMYYSHPSYSGEALLLHRGRSPSHQFHHSCSTQFLNPSTEFRYQFSPHNRRCQCHAGGVTSLKSHNAFHEFEFEFCQLSPRLNMDRASGNAGAFSEYTRRNKQMAMNRNHHHQQHHHHSGRRHIRPVANGAPFLVCYNCLNVLELPSDFLHFKTTTSRRIHRFKCDACSTILKFQLQNANRLIPRHNTAETLTSSSGDGDDVSQVPQTRSSTVHQSASQLTNEIVEEDATSLPMDRQQQQGNIEKKQPQRKGKQVMMVQARKRATKLFN